MHVVGGGVHGVGEGVHGGGRTSQEGVNERAVHILLEYILVILILLQKVNVQPHSH